MGDKTDCKNDRSWSNSFANEDYQETTSTRQSYYEYDHGQDANTAVSYSDQSTTTPLIKISHFNRIGDATISTSSPTLSQKPPMKQENKTFLHEYFRTQISSGARNGTTTKDSFSKESNGMSRRQQEALDMINALDDVFQWISHALNGMQFLMNEIKTRMDKTDETVRTVAQRLKSQKLTIQTLDKRMLVLENANPDNTPVKGQSKPNTASMTTTTSVPLAPWFCTQQIPSQKFKSISGAEKSKMKMGVSLLKAAQQGRVESTRKLLDSGADVNFHYGLNWTSLHMAAKAHPGVLSLLLKRGADVNARTTNGFTPLHIAAYFDYDGRCVGMLVNGGSDLDGQNGCGWTPLHYAAACGNEAAVKALLAGGARKGIKDNEQRTPEDVAATSVRHLLASLSSPAKRKRSKAAQLKDEKDELSLPRWR